MELTPSTSLAEMACSGPALTRALERLGLDYCCGGRRSLEEACRQQGLDPAAVFAELSREPVAAEPPAAWMALSPAELVDHLEATHHRYLKEELPRLTDLAAKVCRVHGERHPQLIRAAALLGEIRGDLEPHLRREEEVLFPRIRALASASHRSTSRSLSSGAPSGSLAEAIAVLEDEHTVVGGLLEQLRALTNGYQAPPDTCASTRALMAGLAELEADLHLHVHKENNQLFPAVVALASQA